MKYARIVNNAAVDVTTGDPGRLFHPDIAAQFEPVPEDVMSGSVRDTETNTWAPPPAPPPPIPAPPAGNLRPTPPEFMSSAFTYQERVAIRATRGGDPVIDDFLRLIDDPRLTMVDLTLGSTRDAILYLTTTSPALLTPERAAQVLAGLPAPSATEATS